MKKRIAIIAILTLILLGIGIYMYSNNTNNNSNYEAERTASNSNDNSEAENNSNSTDEQTAEEAQAQEEAEQAQAEDAKNNATPVEAEELASFSTKIYSKDSSRQNNISITCSTLNNTDVANGATFSFCNTVGKATSSKGYQEADIYQNGQKTKGYGGR